MRSQALASSVAEEHNRERPAGVSASRNVPGHLRLVRQGLVRAASDRGSMSPDVAATLEMLVAHRAAIDGMVHQPAGPVAERPESAGSWTGRPLDNDLENRAPPKRGSPD